MFSMVSRSIIADWTVTQRRREVNASVPGNHIVKTYSSTAHLPDDLCELSILLRSVSTILPRLPLWSLKDVRGNQVTRNKCMAAAAHSFPHLDNTLTKASAPFSLIDNPRTLRSLNISRRIAFIFCSDTVSRNSNSISNPTQTCQN